MREQVEWATVSIGLGDSALKCGLRAYHWPLVGGGSEREWAERVVVKASCEGG